MKNIEENILYTLGNALVESLRNYCQNSEQIFMSVDLYAKPML